MSEVAGMTKKRLIGVWVLIVVASILLVGTTTSVWVKRQALDTDNWVNAADEALDNPAVRDALATFIVDQLYANVNVAQELSDQLPENLQGIAGPIAAGLREPATVAVEKLLQTNAVQKVWHDANKAAHQKLVDILEDKGTYVDTEDGTVTLELGKLVKALGEQLGLPQAALDKIPASAGNIEIAKSSQLANAQKAVKAIKWMGVILFVVVVLIYGLAVFLAKDARRRTLRNVGWSVFVVAIILGATRRLTGNWILGLSSDASLKPAIAALYAIGSELLKNLIWVIGVWGLVLVVGSILAGPTRFAVWARRTLAPLLNREPWEVAAGAAIVYVLLLLWAPTPALQAWPSVLLLAVVWGLGIWMLRTRTLAQFPEATLGGTGEGVRDKLGSAWGSVTGTVKGWGGGGGGGNDSTAELERLAALHDSGKLSDDEFASAKARLLA
jgi:hypothetical protein